MQRYPDCPSLWPLRPLVKRVITNITAGTRPRSVPPKAQWGPPRKPEVRQVCPSHGMFSSFHKISNWDRQTDTGCHVVEKGWSGKWPLNWDNTKEECMNEWMNEWMNAWTYSFLGQVGQVSLRWRPTLKLPQTQILFTRTPRKYVFDVASIGQRSVAMAV